jgi:hypothetical protein
MACQALAILDGRAAGRGIGYPVGLVNGPARIAFSWPIDDLAGHYLANVKVVGHSL